MSEQQLPFDQMVAAWIADAGAEAAAGAPQDVLDGILATTRTTRPRPRWWAAVAEPTMRTRTTRAAVGIANRRLVLAVVLALLAIALAAAAVGA
ncbi:MAG TPA: hypothetical protein VIK65_03715, partial [Candidatus Limnocylindrales bacterium]